MDCWRTWVFVCVLFLANNIHTLYVPSPSQKTNLGGCGRDRLDMDGGISALIWHFIRTSVDDDDDDGETKSDDEDWLCSASDGLYKTNLLQKKYRSTHLLLVLSLSLLFLYFAFVFSPSLSAVPKLCFPVFLAPFFRLKIPFRPPNPSCRRTPSSPIRGPWPLPTHLLLDRPENTCPAHRRVGILQTC